LKKRKTGLGGNGHLKGGKGENVEKRGTNQQRGKEKKGAEGT